tara:strand:- start:3 stop:452 length:450 start_codon:yes stop_codon:yes gene_type:complete
MNKIISTLTILFLIMGCSYEPILSNKKENFRFNIITMEGDNTINEIIKRNLMDKKSGNKVYNIHLSSIKNKDIVSLNEKSDPTSFKLEVVADYKVTENNVIILKNKISKEVRYNNINDKFELSKYEDSILKNLSEIISSEVILSIRAYK